jgi:hypothetical protein
MSDVRDNSGALDVISLAVVKHCVVDGDHTAAMSSRDVDL